MIRERLIKGDFEGPAPMPPRCDALPGTKKKIKVLTIRVRNRQSLFRPDEPEYRPGGEVFIRTVNITR